jgi:hypothetical protein
MELPENELKAKITFMSRDEIINWLKWNDPNGVYSIATHFVNLEIACQERKGKRLC